MSTLMIVLLMRFSHLQNLTLVHGAGCFVMSLAEEMAAKLAVKITFPVILFIFPSMFVVLAGPATIRIFEVL